MPGSADKVLLASPKSLSASFHTHRPPWLPRRWPLTWFLWYWFLYNFSLLLVMPVYASLAQLYFSRFWISHRWYHTMFFSNFLLLLLLLFWLNTLVLKHKITSFTTVLCGFHFMTRVQFTFLLSDGHESCFQLWGITNNYIKPSCTRLLVYMYENLSRAVAFKLFWPWLILKNDVLHHNTHLCIKQRKKFHQANILWSETLSDIFYSDSLCFTNPDHYPLNWFHNPLKWASNFEKHRSRTNT